MNLLPRGLALLVSLLLVLTGMQSVAMGQQDSRPAFRVRLHYNRAGGIYDPARWAYTSDWFIYPSVFNWLVRWKPGPNANVLEPDLAEKWDAAADGLTYTFHLRKGVQFHRGFGELTAEDVAFSFGRQMIDQTLPFNRAVANIRAIQVPDRYTVRIILRERDASFMRTVISYRPGLIVSKKAVQQLGETFAKTPVGTGPFEFVELSRQGEVVIRAHDGYYRRKPASSQLTFVHIGDENTVAAALRRGDIQIAWTRGNPEVVRILRDDPKVRTVRVVEYDNVFQVQFSPKFKPTQDVRVRQAMAYAVDRRVMAQALPGLDEMADVLRPPQLYAGSRNVQTYAYDPAKAQALLREAGYPGGLLLKLMVPRREPETMVGEILAAQWQAVGLDVRLDLVDGTAAFDLRNSGDFDATIFATARPGDPNLFFWDVFHSDAVPPYGSNFLRYKSAEVDALIDAGRVELDQTRRIRIYQTLQQKLMRDLPVIPLFYRAYVLAMVPPVKIMMPGAFNMFWGETIEVQR